MAIGNNNIHYENKIWNWITLGIFFRKSAILAKNSTPIIRKNGTGRKIFSTHNSFPSRMDRKLLVILVLRANKKPHRFTEIRWVLYIKAFTNILYTEQLEGIILSPSIAENFLTENTKFKRKEKFHSTNKASKSSST